MSLSRILGLKPGVSAVMGSGGKTTTLRVLGEEQTGRVVLCTTTHIRPFEGLPLYTGDSEAEVRALLERERLVCVGQRGPEGKLVAPRLSIQSLAQMADYVLVEADGSRQQPVKAHAPHEPVIPKESGQVFCVVGASGFGKKVEETVHRPEIFCRLTGAGLGDQVTPHLVARAIAAEGLTRRVFVNQTDTPEDWRQAEELARALEKEGISTAAGSLRQGVYRRLGGTW